MLGTVGAVLLGISALGAGAGASKILGGAASDKANARAASATDKAKQEAEQKALMESQQEDKTRKARQSLLEAPTAGYGPNKNLARSFLTTF